MNDDVTQKDDPITAATPGAKQGKPGSAFEVLLVFFKLGVTRFGGPLAHIGYFREEFVVRRRWLDEQTYADLVGLCQFLPGPASSQVGFSIGLMRAGYGGGLAAWTGFTLPSAIALVLFAYGAGALTGPAGLGVLHGLKLVAVAIVGQAVWGMARTLCPDRERGPQSRWSPRSLFCSARPRSPKSGPSCWAASLACGYVVTRHRPQSDTWQYPCRAPSASRR